MKSVFLATVVALTIACLGEALIFDAAAPVSAESSAAAVGPARTSIDAPLRRGLCSLDVAGARSPLDRRLLRPSPLSHATATND